MANSTKIPKPVNGKKSTAPVVLKKTNVRVRTYGSGFDPKEIRIDDRTGYYDPNDGDHGWYNSSCCNPHDAG